MKVTSRFLILFLCFLLFFLVTGCTRNSNKLEGLWRSTQATIRADYETPLDKYGIYHFYENNKLDLGNYDYSSDDYFHNYVWGEKSVNYEWIDENTIVIKYMGSNIFKVYIEDSKLTLESEGYSIEFKKVNSKQNSENELL